MKKGYKMSPLVIMALFTMCSIFLMGCGAKYLHSHPKQQVEKQAKWSKEKPGKEPRQFRLSISPRGRVSVEGIATLDEASQAFWNKVQLSQPYISMLKGDKWLVGKRNPKTNRWEYQGEAPGTGGSDNKPGPAHVHKKAKAPKGPSKGSPAKASNVDAPH